jgi:hypothetical protein
MQLAMSTSNQLEHIGYCEYTRCVRLSWIVLVLTHLNYAL